MSFGLNKPQVSPIAVDFGVSALKVLQVIPGNNNDSPTLIGAASLSTPDELLSDDQQRLAYQSEQLPKLMRGMGFKGKRAVCAVSALQSLTQSVQVQKAGNIPLADIVKEQLRQAIGRDPASFVLRTFEVGEVVRSGQKCTEVLCMAIPREVVMMHMKALRNARLDPVGIQTEHMSVLRAFDPLVQRSNEPNAPSMYVDFGCGSTKVLIAHGRNPVLAKTLPAYSRSGEQMMSRRPSTIVEQEAGAAGTTTAVLDEVTDAGAGVEALAEEIGMCLRYYQALFPGKTMERAVFVGGEARRSEVCRAVARSLRLPAQVADPLSALARENGSSIRGLALQSAQPGWAVPIGLCLSPTDL